MNVLTRQKSADIPNVATLRHWLQDKEEIAFVDIREEGIHAQGHPLFAVNIPFSRLEIDFPRLVPRAATRVVLLSESSLAPTAKQRISALGYHAVHVLDGGIEAWTDAGQPLFASANVPSKAFAEYVEQTYHTPHIEAFKLDALIKSGADVVILDSRTTEEFERFHVPGAISAPGPDVIHSFSDFVKSSETFVVVSCAGRTRGIIGAQALINAGVPNKVAALSGGTQGWQLAGLELEWNTPRPQRKSPSAEAREVAHRLADRIARRFAVPLIGLPTLKEFRADTERTTYLFDVRSPAEFGEDHAAHFLSAPGGQLVQAVDKYAGTRGARIVLTDDDGVRAIVTAHWLRQLGWDAFVLPGFTSGEAPPPSPHYRPRNSHAVADVIATHSVKAWLDNGAILLSVDASADYRRSHPEGAIWTNRSRLRALPSKVRNAQRVIVTACDRELAQLAAVDIAELGAAHVAVFPGGDSSWQAAGLRLISTPDEPKDEDRIDHVSWLHDRHTGNPVSSRAYLDWEAGLPVAIGLPETVGFRIGAVAA